jgi:hypothetical protein
LNPNIGVSEVERERRPGFIPINAILDAGSGMRDFDVLEAFSKAAAPHSAAAHRHRGPHVIGKDAGMTWRTGRTAGLRDREVSG